MKIARYLFSMESVSWQIRLVHVEYQLDVFQSPIHNCTQVKIQELGLFKCASQGRNGIPMFIS
jgi:hypothetical protein